MRKSEMGGKEKRECLQRLDVSEEIKKVRE